MQLIKNQEALLSNSQPDYSKSSDPVNLCVPTQNKNDRHEEIEQIHNYMESCSGVGGVSYIPSSFTENIKGEKP